MIPAKFEGLEISSFGFNKESEKDLINVYSKMLYELKTLEENVDSKTRNMNV